MMTLTKKTAFVVVAIGVQAIIAIAPVNAQEFNVTSSLAKASTMTDNQEYLNKARENLKNYETARNNQRFLGNAENALYKINLATENNAAARVQMRNGKLLVLLWFLVILDHDINPNFDPKNAPSGSLFSVLVIDPKLKAEWEKKAEEDEARGRYTAKQEGLRLVEKDISQDTKNFIQSSYTSSTADQQTLKNAIESIIKNPRRKTELLQLLPGLPNE